MATFIVLDDKYDTMAQYDGPVSSMETEWVPPSKSPETEKDEKIKEQPFDPSSSVLSRLHAMGDELCAKMQSIKP